MTASKQQPIQGMSDLGPPEIDIWHRIEQKARDVFRAYDYNEVRTPLVESASLFHKATGDTTDVVQKEMYTFEDRGGRKLSLRPEGTPGIMRYAAGRGQDADEGRFYYMGPMFRAERPQAGRRRQFHQIGIEAMGAPNPLLDAETIALQQHLFAVWGLRECRVELNTRGMPEDRKAVSEGLKEALTPRLAELCDDCRRRFEMNVLRVLDCKNEICKAIVDLLPPVSDFMSEASRQYLEEVKRLLTLLDVPFTVNPRLVRGLDYYVHTVWENKHAGLGAQDAISGGGRYQVLLGDKLVEGVGFAIGVERVAAALEHDSPSGYDARSKPLAWIVSQGAQAREENLILAQTLRMHGVHCGMDLGDRSIKAQMRAANREGAAYVVIRGEREIEKGLVVLKNMNDGTQEELSMPVLAERLILAARAEVVRT